MGLKEGNSDAQNEHMTMADEDEPTEEEAAPPKKGKGMLFGILGAVVMGGIGFAAVFLGFVGGAPEPSQEAKTEVLPLPNVNFLEMDEIIVSLGKNANSKHLKFSGHLEINPTYKEDVTLLLPRVYDVLNTFLRAVGEEEIARPSSLTKLRAQMLRRVQIVTGEGRVRDLLISEFILN